MIQEKLINNNQRDDYVIVTSIEKIINIGTIIFISIIANKFIPSLLFLIFFYELRKRAGGYHAKSFLICYVETIGTYIFILYINSILANQPTVLFCMLVISFCIILGLGSVNHPNLHMSITELTAAKKSSRILLFMEVTVIFFFELIGIEMAIISYMVTAVTMCAILMCMAKILGQEVKKYEKS